MTWGCFLTNKLFFKVLSCQKKFKRLLFTKSDILPPFLKDLPSFRLSTFSKDLPSFTLFLIWIFFPFLPSHVPIIWSTITGLLYRLSTLLIQFYSISLSYFDPFYLFIYLNPFLSPTLPTLHSTQMDPPPWYL